MEDRSAAVQRAASIGTARYLTQARLASAKYYLGKFVCPCSRYCGLLERLSAQRHESLNAAVTIWAARSLWPSHGGKGRYRLRKGHAGGEHLEPRLRDVVDNELVSGLLFPQSGSHIEAVAHAFPQKCDKEESQSRKSPANGLKG
jgi:hypothetical protein